MERHDALCELEANFSAALAGTLGAYVMPGDVTDAHERLSLGAVSEYTVIACEHIHRYEFAASLFPGLRVLDLACGSGYGSRILADSATSVHGIDNDLPTIRDATDTIGSTAITFEAVDVVSFLDGDLSDRLDAIVCFEGLEHLDDLEGAVRKLRKQADRVCSWSYRCQTAGPSKSTTSFT